MTTPLPEEQQTAQNKSDTARTRYVEELAGDGDAWVSITDAARITRTSEAMARRWVTSGRLPVKRQAVGINQHTRLVRLSDVAAIRPIIDPTAAISDDMHTLDLPSIPRQHAQLMHDHKHLLLQVLAGQRSLDELVVQVHDQKKVFEQSQHSYLEQEKKLYHEIKLLQTTFDEQLKTTQTAMKQMMQEKVDALTQQNHDWQEHMERLQQDLTSASRQQDERTQKAFEEMVGTVKRQHEEHQHELTEQQKAFAGQQEALTQFVETQMEAIKGSLEQHARKWEQDRATQTERLEKTEQWLGQVVTQGKDTHSIVLEDQKRVLAWERQLKTLTKTTLDEIKERKRLSEYFIIQQKQMQLLRRELDVLKGQKAEHNISS